MFEILPIDPSREPHVTEDGHVIYPERTLEEIYSGVVERTNEEKEGAE